MRKFLLSTLILILVVSGFQLKKGEAAEQIFSDVPTTHAYFQEINFLLEKGVISPAVKYSVNDIVTREEVAVMVSKAVGLDGTQTSTKFPDVPKSHPSSGYINSAVEAGIINGYLDGTFGPNQKVTRGHMAAFIARGFKLTQEANVTFKDVAKGSTAYEPVRKLAYKGITTGYEDGTFKPNENLSRAHISAFIARAMGFEKSDTQPVTPPVTPPVTKNEQMLVHYIDVGQGDAILIQSPNGKNMLIDGGTKSAGDKVVSFLKSKGVSTLDVVVATHPDADHIGGLIDVLKNFKVNQFIDSGKAHTTQTYYEILQMIDDKNIPFKVAKRNDAIQLDSVLKTNILYADENASDNNDASIVIRTSYGSVSFMFTGDAGTNIEGKLLSRNDIKSTYLKAGHHGSNTSSSASFINAVNPTGTILSYGKDNSYGHPHAEVVERLQTVGSKIYSTAEAGDITITTDGTKHTVSAKPWVAPVKPIPTPTPEPTPSPKESYKNCTELRKVYPNGVQIGHPAYEKKHDRDGDGWACEK